MNLKILILIATIALTALLTTSAFGAIWSPQGFGTCQKFKDGKGSDEGVLQEINRALERENLSQIKIIDCVQVEKPTWFRTGKIKLTLKFSDDESSCDSEDIKLIDVEFRHPYSYGKGDDAQRILSIVNKFKALGFQLERTYGDEWLNGLTGVQLSVKSCQL